MTYSWAGLEPTHGFAADAYRLLISGGASGGSVWRQRGIEETSITLPAYLLEDVQNVRWSPEALGERCGSGTKFDMTFGARPHEFTHATPRAPLSRGAACSTDANGVLAPCPLTDGRYDIGLPINPIPERIDLTLATATEVRRIVFRGLLTFTPSNVVVSVSTDGSNFTRVAATSTDPGFIDLDLGGARTAKVVRLTLEYAGEGQPNPSFPSQFDRLDEVSLWNE